MRSRRARYPRHPDSASYWERAQWPLQSLYFLLPLLVLYELGTLLYAPPGDPRLPPIWAESLLDEFFNVLGVTGWVYLPGLLVVVVLLAWHVLRRDPWRPEPKLYLIMLVESVALAAPLFVLSAVMFRGPPPDTDPADGRPTGAPTLLAPPPLAAAGVVPPPPPAASDPGAGPYARDPATAAAPAPAGPIASWQTGLVYSIGAGIYEELLFRLIAIALLHMLLVDLLALPESWGAAAAVAVSAVAFAFYHFSETNPFHWGRFVFHTAAGLYFAAVYVLRGFGIVAMTHALYDVLVVTAYFAQR